MKSILPPLIYKDLVPTRDYVQAVALTLSALQRAFLPKNPRDWQYGLEVNVRGLVTQPFMVNGEPVQASLDFVRQKVRLGGSAWPLNEYAATEIFNNIQVWLDSHGAPVKLQQPKLTTHAQHFDSHQLELYADALWWMEKQFRLVKTSLHEGLTSPILLYPHHFDLSLVWFPHSDDQQLAIGFSSGDEAIAEPYLYFTAYPELADFKKLVVPQPATLHTTGFNGVVLTYAELRMSPNPVQLFQDYTGLLTTARQMPG